MGGGCPRRRGQVFPSQAPAWDPKLRGPTPCGLAAALKSRLPNQTPPRGRAPASEPLSGAASSALATTGRRGKVNNTPSVWEQRQVVFPQALLQNKSYYYSFFSSSSSSFFFFFKPSFLLREINTKGGIPRK